MQLPPVAATTVGSFPRPTWLEPLRLGDPAVLREAQDDATVLVLREQQEAGLDLVSDGEQRRQEGFIHHVLGGMEGFDIQRKRGKVIRRNRSGQERLVPTVVGKVRRTGPIVLDDLRFAKSHTGLPVKMTVPGPLSAVDSTYDEAYGNEVALAMDIAAAINEEILALQAAGCDVVQIDEPAMTRYHDKTASYGAEALNRCLDGVTIPTLVHLCYGYPGGDRGPGQHEFEYPELLELLMETRIGGFSLEFARSGYDPSILKGCGDRLVLYGCIDPGGTELEPLDLVIGRVHAALQYLAPEQLLIGPDCGLMTLSRDLARQKAVLLASAAQEVRHSLS
jgi:5-methyltetrahydropteroyltriglutamate--homocysteine methyltransferase